MLRKCRPKFRVTVYYILYIIYQQNKVNRISPNEVVACVLPSVVANDGSKAIPTFVWYLFGTLQGRVENTFWRFRSVALCNKYY